MAEYYRNIDWKFIPDQVVQLTAHTYSFTAEPYDSNDPGAIGREVGNYVVDFVGRRYKVTGSTSTTLTVEDENQTGKGPQTGQKARCYQSVGEGDAEYIGSIDISVLDESARWKIHGVDKELLWQKIISLMASEIGVDTDNFDNVLGENDDTVQKALETINDVLNGISEGVTNETLLGVKDEVNTVFLLSSLPNPYSLQVYLNGVRLNTSEYTLTLNEITFTAAPYADDVIEVFYEIYNGDSKQWGEIPNGSINGTNKDFTLTYAPGSLNLYLNGILQQPGVDYTVDDKTITFTLAPYTGDTLIADYKTATAAVSGFYNITPTGSINGTNTAFTLPAQPVAVKVYLNGIRQQPITHYTLSGQTITFTTAPITGDWILCDYTT